MTKLTVTNAASIETYIKALAALNVALPVDLHPEDCGVVIDATGRDVFTVDVNNQRPNTECELIAGWIVLAVNTCGGFRAKHAPETSTDAGSGT